MDLERRAKYFIHLIESKNLQTLKQEVELINGADLVELLESPDGGDALLIFRMVPKDLSIDIFAYMAPYQRRLLVTSVTDEELESISNGLCFDDMIGLLEEMPTSFVNEVLAQTPLKERKIINEFLMYPGDSAESIMTTGYVDLKSEWSVSQALECVKQIGVTKEAVHTYYVRNKYRKLLGLVSLRQLVIENPRAEIEDIMIDNVISVETLDGQEDVVDKFNKYDYLVLLVVDQEHRSIGIITVDDIMDVTTEETTEDLYGMAAIKPSKKNYTEGTVRSLTKNHLPWFLILAISATLTSGIINRYDWIIQGFIILTSSIPILSDTGGNTGSQSSTTIIQALATGDIKINDIWKVILKKRKVDLIADLTLDFANFIRLFFLVKESFLINLLVSLTTLCIVELSKIMGAFLPVMVKKLGFDPTLMASSLISTVIDSCALIIYFGLANLILY